MSEQTSSVLSFEIEIQFSDLISNSKSRNVRNLEGREMAGANQSCIFCQIIRNPTTNTRLLHAVSSSSSSTLWWLIERVFLHFFKVSQDEKVVAFQDIKPAAQRFLFVLSLYLYSYAYLVSRLIKTLISGTTWSFQ